MPNRLARYVRKIRTMRGESLRAAGKALACSYTMVNDIERGVRYPSPPLLMRIAKHYQVPVDVLRQFDPRPPTAAIRDTCQADPDYGFALRRLLASGASAADIVAFADARKPLQLKG